MNNNGKVIAVDVDAVVLDLITKWLALYNHDYDDDLKYEDIVEWDISKLVKPECGEKMFDYLHYPNLYTDIQPMPGAIEGVQALRNLGARVIFVTAGINFGKFHRLVELGLLPDSQYEAEKDYIVAHDKYLIKADILIDDRDLNIKTFPGWGILMDQPWNRAFKSPFRAWDWSYVVHLARTMFGYPLY
jgi:5'-nucleotidase